MHQKPWITDKDRSWTFNKWLLLSYCVYDLEVDCTIIVLLTHTNTVSYGGPWALWSLHLKCRAVVGVWLWRNPRNRLYLSWTPMNHKEQEGRSEVTALRLTGKIHFMGTFWSHLWRRQGGLVGDEVYELRFCDATDHTRYASKTLKTCKQVVISYSC